MSIDPETELLALGESVGFSPMKRSPLSTGERDFAS
jgi:hypothetical protein